MKQVETVAAGLAGAAVGAVAGVVIQRRKSQRYFDVVQAEVEGALEEVIAYKAQAKRLIGYYRQTNTDLAGMAARIAKLLDLHDDAHPGASAHDPDWVASRVAEQVRRMEQQGWQFDADPDDMSVDGWFTVISPPYEKDPDDG